MKIYLVRFIIAVCFQFVAGPLSAQDKCNIKNLSAIDIKELNDFWDSFKIALNSADTQKLITLISFPFATNYTGKVKQKDLNKIGEIFFSSELVNTVNGFTSFESFLLVHGDFAEKHRSCSYDFFYNLKSKEIHFNLTRIDNDYKIISSWSR